LSASSCSSPPGCLPPGHLSACCLSSCHCHSVVTMSLLDCYLKQPVRQACNILMLVTCQALSVLPGRVSDFVCEIALPLLSVNWLLSTGVPVCPYAFHMADCRLAVCRLAASACHPCWLLAIWLSAGLLFNYMAVYSAACHQAACQLTTCNLATSLASMLSQPGVCKLTACHLAACHLAALLEPGFVTWLSAPGCMLLLAMALSL